MIIITGQRNPGLLTPLIDINANFVLVVRFLYTKHALLSNLKSFSLVVRIGKIIYENVKFFASDFLRRVCEAIRLRFSY